MGNKLTKEEYSFCKPLFLFYVTTGAVVNLHIYTNSYSVSPDVFLAFVASTWSGAVLSISFTESWVKFKAPFVPHALKIDIGRYVFKALNAVEGGMSITMLSTLYLFKDELRNFNNYGTYVKPLIASGIIALQILNLTPKLDLLAKAAIMEEVKKNDIPYKSESDVKNIAQLRAELNATTTMNVTFGKKLHVLYVGLEVIKIVSLGTYALTMFSQV